ncbi:MAG: hypothetical protein ABFD90_15260 [Phycisphaerales bacterium]
MLTGYVHPDYAKSLAAYGTPRELPRSGGWVLERPIPDSPYRDAMGCYPLFACQDWSGLKADLDDLASDLVSICLVPDPFGGHTPDSLAECFPDKFLAFKEHYVLDLQCDLQKVIKRKTRQAINAALRHLTVELCSNPAEYLDEWVRTYGYLVEKHQLSGIHRFSRDSFAVQMTVPGFHLFRALRENHVEGMASWYVQGDVAYGHLLGVSPRGYELNVLYAIFWAAIQHFLGKARWVDFGGLAGTEGDSESGMALFKRKWASTTRPAYLCGRIFNHEAYGQIVRAKDIPETDYFPAYRVGEFRPASTDTHLAEQAH